MTSVLTIDNLLFHVCRSPRRTTLEIIVDRNGDLLVSAPIACPDKVIESVVREKLLWVYRKLAEKQRLLRPSLTKMFVNGEGFRYLGRSYRLLLVKPSDLDQSTEPLRLHQGRFKLRQDERHRGVQHFINWYIKQSYPWLQRRAQIYTERIGVEECPIRIRDLGFRWGTCSARRTITFHWRTILLPPPIIDYVVAHEIVHLCEPHHGACFWNRLERAMPDFAERKQWLAENGSDF